MKIYGTVHLFDWISSPRGQVKGVRGEIEILSDEEAVGFKSRGHNSANWIAIVRGGTEAWHIFGCQIRAVTEHAKDAPELVDCWSAS